MRTLRVSLIGTVVMALLGGTGAMVAAQEGDGEPPTPNGVVISATESAHAQGFQVRESPDQAYFAYSEDTRSDYTYEATDPRLSGQATYIGKWRYYPSPVDANVEAVALTVVNEDGTWAGTGRGIASPDFGDILWLVLTGDGAYEGLTAYLTQDYVHEEGTIKGVIVADELPEFPEPVFAE